MSRELINFLICSEHKSYNSSDCPEGEGKDPKCTYRACTRTADNEWDFIFTSAQYLDESLYNACGLTTKDDHCPFLCHCDTDNRETPTRWLIEVSERSQIYISYAKREMAGAFLNNRRAFNYLGFGMLKESGHPRGLVLSCVH